MRDRPTSPDTRWEDAPPLLFACGVVVAALALAAIAGVSTVGGWLVAAMAAACLGLVSGRAGQARLLAAAIPCTMLTGSAIVPFSGRYVPAAFVMGALVVAGRHDLGDGVVWARRRPILAVAIMWYIAWAAVTTVTSIEPWTSALYVAGFILAFGCAILVCGRLLAEPSTVRLCVEMLAILGIAQVLCGWLLTVVGPVVAYGNALGLYFIEEFAVLGRRTGVTTYQAYGPFVGPSTVPLALGIAAAVYLCVRARSRTASAAWLVGTIVMAIGLIASMSREGILMAALASGTVALFAWPAARLRVTPLITASVLGVAFLAAITGVVTVSGRLDLVAQRYGAGGVAVLMNPDLAERGKALAGDRLGPSAGAELPSPSGGSTLGGPTSGGTPSYPAVIDLKTQSSLIARISLWQASIDATARSPLVGYGPGTNADAIGPYLSASDPYLVGATAHSTVFRTVVEMGIPGLLALITFMGLAIWAALRAVWFVRNGWADPGIAVLAACVFALAAHQVFGTMLLGGFEYADWVLSIAVVGLVGAATARGTGMRRPQADV